MFNNRPLRTDADVEDVPDLLGDAGLLVVDPLNQLYVVYLDARCKITSSQKSDP
jgi:hypothetical protein